MLKYELTLRYYNDEINQNFKNQVSPCLNQCEEGKKKEIKHVKI